MTDSLLRLYCLPLRDDSQGFADAVLLMPYFPAFLPEFRHQFKKSENFVDKVSDEKSVFFATAESARLKKAKQMEKKCESCLGSRQYCQRRGKEPKGIV